MCLIKFYIFNTFLIIENFIELFNLPRATIISDVLTKRYFQQDQHKLFLLFRQKNCERQMYVLMIHLKFLLYIKYLMLEFLNPRILVKFEKTQTVLKENFPFLNIQKNLIIRKKSV